MNLGCDLFHVEVTLSTTGHMAEPFPNHFYVLRALAAEGIQNDDTAEQ
jgi:hypothetical protein